MTDKLLYERALRDFEESRDENLWLKSVVECSGDEGKAKYLYIRLRVEELSTAPAEMPTVKNAMQDARSKSSDHQVKSEALVAFGKQFALYVEGTLAGSVQERFCQILKAKKFDDVLCDLFANQDVILVAPSAKDRSGIALAGLVLTGGSGVIGVLGMAAGMALGQIFKNKQAEGVKSTIQNLANTIVIDSRSVELRAYDYRRTWDLAGGEWETRVSIEGKAIFNDIEGTIRLVFACEGKTYQRTFFARANNKVPELAKLLGKPVPSISRETKFIW